MKVKKSTAFYKNEFELFGTDKDIIKKNESINEVTGAKNEIIQLEETEKRKRLLSVLLADYKWTINQEGKVTYINPYVDDCIGNDAKYIIKKIVSRYLPQLSVMACLIELEELNEMLRTSRNTHQRKLIVDILKNESGIKKIEILSSAIFDSQGNVVGIQGLCNYLE